MLPNAVNSLTCQSALVPQMASNSTPPKHIPGTVLVVATIANLPMCSRRLFLLRIVGELTGWATKSRAFMSPSVEGFGYRPIAAMRLAPWPASRKPSMKEPAGNGRRWRRERRALWRFNLGEWRGIAAGNTTALELARKNANEPACALCHLTLSWLHVEAMDFEGARALCESIDDKFLNEITLLISISERSWRRPS